MSKSKTLVMGSCRLTEPFKDDPNFILYPGGHAHCTSAFLQALDVMAGKVVVPKKIEEFAFRGWGSNNPDKEVDLSKVSNVVMELCSFKCVKYGDLILSHVCATSNGRKGLPKAKTVKVHIEAPDEIRSNLYKLKKRLKGKTLIFVLNNNITGVMLRYKLGYIVSDWCIKNKVTFFDPTSLIATYGIPLCFPTSDSHPKKYQFNSTTYDPYHYTEFMKRIIHEHIQTLIGPSEE